MTKTALPLTKRGYICTLTLLASASVLTSCQDEDFDVDKGEITQAYLDRKFAEEFHKEFPNADPNHTWMCAPDTLGVESLIQNAMTRAYVGNIEITPLSTKGSTTEAEVQTILGENGKLPERHDNRGEVSQSFEYFALKDEGNGYQTYTVTPMFWGRKFCDANQIGVYYIGNDNQKHDLSSFWSDQDSKIKAVFTDGCTEDIKISDQQINEDPLWANYQRHPKLGHNCHYCGFDIYTKAPESNPTKIENRSQLVSNYGEQYIELTTTDCSESYNTKLMIQTPNKSWDSGEDYVLTFKYWVSKNVQNVPIQFQSGLYTHVEDAYNNPDKSGNKLLANFTHKDNSWSWTEMKIEGKVTYHSNDKNINTIILALALESGVTYRFTDISWKRLHTTDSADDKNKHSAYNNTPYCNGTCKVDVDHYELPQYQIKVPVGMKWGFYLKTKKQQNDTNNYTQTWYSNANFNEVTDKKGNHGFVSAAATYQVADPNNSGKAITYCCFEDAACELHEFETPEAQKGNCECGYGHFDTDYNDIIFKIVSDPVVVSSYKSLKYRVMCEDLGGSWDWDFNDIVYDVEYSDALNMNDQNAKATIKVTLQAVGGTLPVYMQFTNSSDSKYHITSMSVDNNSSGNQTRDLHLVLSDQTQDSRTKLYLPVNVPPDGGQQTIQNRPSQVVCTYTLNGKKFNDLDPRIFVDLIDIKVQQNPTSSTNTTTTVTFPTRQDANGPKVPECFMTSISVPWPNEHQKISNRFPGFELWVNRHDQNSKWWSEGFGGGTTKAVTQ